VQGFSSKRSDNENNNSTSSFFCDPWETITYVLVVMSYAVFEFSSELFGLRHQKYHNLQANTMLNFKEQNSQFENLNLDQFRQNINMDFQNWPIRYFDDLKHEYLRIIQMLCAITLMCNLLLPMQLVPLQ